jgi:hypothetical protein
MGENLKEDAHEDGMGLFRGTLYLLFWDQFWQKSWLKRVEAVRRQTFAFLSELSDKEGNNRQAAAYLFQAFFLFCLFPFSFASGLFPALFVHFVIPWRI